ncbi:MAG: ribonucleoside triphosphate reductase [Candidatus Micrarchaeota archaeon]
MLFNTKIKKIRKRDGRVVDFDQGKVKSAIFKSAKAVGGTDNLLAEQLSDKVVMALERKYTSWEIPDVESIQDTVEKVLIEEGHAKTAKAYILYRDQRAKIRESKLVVDYIDNTIDNYLRQSDWRVNENSNSGYSLSGLLMHAAGTVVANYTLSNVYPPEISNAHKNGDFHIHDLSMGISGYCAGWSLRQLITEGFNGVPGKIDSRPAKHLNSALWQMINFMGTLQNEWAGAQAFSSVDTYLAPFIKYDGLDYKRVKQAIQGFVFNMNVPSRWGGQTPFSNITLDWTVPDDMASKKAIIGGTEQGFTYGDCVDEMALINRAFIEVMTEGDAKGRVFTFPIPTYNVTRDFDWGSENAQRLFEMTAKYGLPYFQNFINSTLKPSDVRSMCCRLQLDVKELKNRGGGLFGAGEMTGSVGVVTINLPRIGYLARDDNDYFEKLGGLMELASRSIEIKREVVQKNIDNGLMPYSKRYLLSLHNHFSTIGINGMNESLMNFMDVGIATNEGRTFSLRVLDFMRERMREFQDSTGVLYNLEATPAEGTSYRLAKIDKAQYPKIITANEAAAQKGAAPYYTNSTHLPVGHTEDLFEALEHQDDLQTKYTGGTVFHGFLGENMSSTEACGKLVKRIAYNFRLPYYTITPTFSVCPEHGYVPGRHNECPKPKNGNGEKCARSCEVYSRVVGYFRPVQNWNLGKKQEFGDRKEYSEMVATASKFGAKVLVK